MWVWPMTKVGENVTQPRDEMVEVPAGTFVMGCHNVAVPKCEADAQPRHRVTLDAYAIDTYEVTVADYRSCMVRGKCSAPNMRDDDGCGLRMDQPDKPIRCVDHSEAWTYCEAHGKRLPTEAEWERAARGLDERIFPWGDDPPQGHACWHGHGPCGVGSFPSGISPVGAHDMAGNVSEWVSDNVHPQYYRYSPRKNPTGYHGPPLQHDTRICGDSTCTSARGGSWRDPLELLTTTARNIDGWQFRSDLAVEFRCARSTDP